MTENIKILNSKELLAGMGINDWKDSDFTVLHNVRPKKLSAPYPIRSADYLIGFVSEGSIKILLNLQKVTLHKNSLIVVKPYDILERLSQSNNFKISGFTFTKEFIVDHVGNISLLDNMECLNRNEAPVITIGKEYVERLNELFVTINFLAKRTSNPYRKKMIKNLFELILYGIDAAYQKKERINTIKRISRKEELTNQFKKLLIQNYKEQRSVNFYATNLFVTAKYLSETVKETTGKTAGELIDDMVILEAKILLKNSTGNISEIANMLHFSDQFFFSNFFKKHTGLSPSNYRKVQGK